MKQIAYITDIHFDEQFTFDNGVNPDENWRFILEELKKKGIKVVIFGGDIGGKNALPGFFKSLESFQLHVTPGNHDSAAALASFLHIAVDGSRTEIYNAFEDEHLKYIFLDSSAERLSEYQFLWLQQQLETNKKTLVFIHHPVLEVETFVDKKYPLEGRDKVVELMEKSGNEILVFCGHYHMQDERIRNNIRQVITPAASFQIARNVEELIIDNSFFGYSIITIDKGEVRWERIVHPSEALQKQ